MMTSKASNPAALTSHAASDRTSATWRIALLALAVTLGLTNIVELAGSLRPGYWSSVGYVPLIGDLQGGKLVVESDNDGVGTGIPIYAHGQVAARMPEVKAGDRVAVAPDADTPSKLAFAPSALEFDRFRPREEQIRLRLEHGTQTKLVVAAHTRPLASSDLFVYYSQIIVDLVFALVGCLLAWSRPDDRAVRALAISMICWSSNIPRSIDSPAFDILFLINQLTARVWVQILLVYWAIHLSALSRWGISRTLQRFWPLWALCTIALGFAYRLSVYYPVSLPGSMLHRLVNANEVLLFVAPLLALTEGIFSSTGENRTRMRWGLFVFGFYFALFPFRLFLEPVLDAQWPDGIPSGLLDNALQLVLPLGLLYATLRHRLLDLSFAINRGLVYGAISAILLVTFFGLEKISESVLKVQGREQNALIAACIAFGIFLFFHKMRDWVEHNVERVFFSAWHRRELALREYVRSAAHITRIEALADSCLAALDRFTGGAGSALYRRERAGSYRQVSSTLSDAPTMIDGNDPAALAMRVDRAAVACADTGSSLAQELALPILHRGDVDGFVLLNRKLSQEDYRPDEIELLSFAVQQVGLDLTALEREQFREQATELEARASSASSHAEELRELLQLALTGHRPGAGDNS